MTGQHPALDVADHGLRGFDTVELACPGEADPDRHARRVADDIAGLLDTPPDLLVVQGDTSSALGGALAGFERGVPVAHVEAGLRTHDTRLPWPEEGYRTRIDAGSVLLFAPTAGAADNLRGEAVAGAIHVTGNTAIDAVLSVAAQLPRQSQQVRERRSVLVTCHRRESWGEGLRSVAAALRQLAGDGIAAIDVILPPNAHVAQTMRGLLQGCANLSLIEPCGHARLIELMRDADLVLSDSGGMQEEAPALGVPLLVLRDKSERPEGIASGNMRLVGTLSAGIVAEARRILGDPAERARMSRRAFPYGDGKAAPRIAAIIAQWLAARPPAPAALTRGSAPGSRS